ncbi:MAG: DNRLRE domain-containing protein [Planctomycetota bacterium]
MSVPVGARLWLLATLCLWPVLVDSAEPVKRVAVSFQQGVEEYSGTIDTEVWALAVNTILESNPNATSDADNDGGESQVLIRFDDIFGTGQRKIPPGATIHSAKLLVSAFDQGSTVNLHRMLVPFDRSATWNSLVSAVSADGLEASRHKDSFTFGKIAANSTEIVFEVTDTMQTWVNGETNHGWVFINTGGNGWDFYTSEFDNVSQRPKLVVEFTPLKSQ